MLDWLLAGLLCMCGTGGPVDGPYEKADRLDNQVLLAELPPPPPQVPVFESSNDGRTCHGAIPLLAYYSPGWDVERMARIMWRESNCQPGAMNSRSSASGLLQMLANTHCGWIRVEFGECSRQWLADPVNNIRAAASLYEKQGMSAWATR